MKSDQIKNLQFTLSQEKNLLYWSIFSFVAFVVTEQTPAKTQLHLKSPKDFILLASFHLNVYTKIISISSPLYNAFFSIYKYQ